MKPSKSKKAPKVASPSSKKPNYMREADDNKKIPIMRKRPLAK